MTLAIPQRRERAQAEYYKCLHDLVLTDSGDETYDLLIRELYAYNFEAVIDRDLNRVNDGLQLREKYMGDDSDYIDGECSVLELMIALAQRIDDIMYDPDVGEDWVRWFWEMIENLGLDKFPDSNFSTKAVDLIIQRFIDRKYDSDGLGGLFPLMYPDSRIDQRDVEIWYQMQAYLNENY